MAREVTLVDAGLGTVMAVERALLQIGVAATISNDPDKVAISRLIIFPGYSAHDSGIRKLVDGAMGEALCMVIRRGDPFLAIDVGMQLLFDGFHRNDQLLDGLHILPGICQPIEPSVVAPSVVTPSIPATTIPSTSLEPNPIPSTSLEPNPPPLLNEGLGFSSSHENHFQEPIANTNNQVQPPHSDIQLKVPHVGWNEVEPTGEHFYFSNCEHVVPSLADDVLWTAYYGSVVIPAAVRRENVFGCQFRPEISQRSGLRFLRSFLLETRN